MDSINLLSTIDSLRSIVVNENKQIILSIIDENFHNLLNKKMPPILLKSKFIELETFGKVRADRQKCKITLFHIKKHWCKLYLYISLHLAPKM